jgi:hypothetical protein
MKYFKPTLILTAVILASTSALIAQINTFSEDFESMNVADGTDDPSLADAGWLMYVNVFNSDRSVRQYGYGNFVAPNHGRGVSAVVTGQGGTEQGNNQLSIYSNYDDSVHGSGGILETNMFREATIDSSNVGQTWQFQFDAKMGNLVAPSTALAFIKTLDPSAGFAMTNFVTEDMTSISTTWSTYSINLPITASLSGQIFQIGFTNDAANYDNSGIFYDNVSLTVVPEPSTWALMGGLVTFLFVAVRRYRGRRA